MLELAARKNLLARADRRVAAGEARLALQALHVEQLQATGEDARRSEATLREMVQSLDLLREVRAEIQRSVEQLEVAASLCR